MARIRRLAFPLAFDSRTGHLAAVDQDTLDDIGGCVEILLQTRIGDHIERPDFGTIGLLFTQLPVDLPTALEHIAQWEPRARLLADQDPSRFEDLVAAIQIKLSTVRG